MAGQVAKSSSDPAASEVELRAAVRLASAASHPAVIARSLVELVLVVGELESRLADGEALARDARAALLELHDDELEANLLENESFLALRRGEPDRALGLAQRSLELTARQRGPDHYEVGAHLVNLARIHHARRDFAAAERASTQGVTLLERAYGAHHPRLAQALSNHAVHARAVGHRADATRVLLRALAIKRATPSHSDLWLAPTFTGLGNLWLEEEQLIPAERMARQALEILERHLGSDHDRTATPLINLAAALRGQGRHVEARAALDRARATLAATRSATDPEVAEVDCALATSIAATGDTASAIARRTAALAALANHPLDAVGDLIAACQLDAPAELIAAGRIAAAESAARDALARFERDHGTADDRVATARIQIGRAELAGNRPAEARATFARVIADVGPARWVTVADAQLGAGEAMLALGDARGAVLALSVATAIRSLLGFDPIAQQRCAAILDRARVAAARAPATR